MIQSPTTVATKHKSSTMTVTYTHDLTRFDYSLMTSKNGKVFENTGRNTNIEFMFDTKMIIHAKNNANDAYRLEFVEAPQAKIFANRIFSTTPQRYTVS